MQALAEETGLEPKAPGGAVSARRWDCRRSPIARILRFNAAVRRINADGASRRLGGDRAGSAGYYDQAHFNHDFREFTGVTPGEYLARMIPDGGVQA